MFKLSILKELWGFLKIRKRLWLLPIVIVLVTLGMLLVVAQMSNVSPFLYALF